MTQRRVGRNDYIVVLYSVIIGWTAVTVSRQTFYVKTQSAFKFGKLTCDSIVRLLRLSCLGV